MTLPSWLYKKLPRSKSATEETIQKHQIHTVCDAAKCPNRCECFHKKSATFLALGNICTRHCKFCHISSAKNPPLPDPFEGAKIAAAIQDLSLKHAVITMVTRDDLADGGASYIKNILQVIKKSDSSVILEVLTSDFNGNLSSLDLVLEEAPHIFNHNIETVAALTSSIRDRASFTKSLFVLTHAKKSNRPLYVKSGFMVGLGESEEEIKSTLQALADSGVDIVTIGQYLQPTKKNIAVKRYVPINEFSAYKAFGESLGITKVFAAPFVRSSYLAKELLEEIAQKSLLQKKEI